MIHDAKSSEECAVNAGVFEGFILDPTPFQTWKIPTKYKIQENAK